ncbi:uncharacterized protein LOC131874261 [Cryptomeria japonica]|uniref:uncharacterized protein LOC131874261 n=1 Tax=Cryptomeria japonica TaxID=3369 RepID=UPI0027DA5CB5|nr:uncharacterized protein LOC131874261 [Cryptomeria japonica]
MAYEKIPFGLSNAGATFQRAMDMAFYGLMYKFVLVYLDDITVYSKNSVEHLAHLKKLFERCREYGISLNPNKYVFYVHEGKLLGYVVSNEGITIDLKRDIPFSWSKDGPRSFELIKEALAAAPTLLNPEFSKDFMLYAYGSIDNILAMSVQENEHGLEHPLAFLSQGLKNYEEKYFVEKHLKSFFLNKDLNDKRAGWVTKVMEFDVDIKVTKLVRGKGLCEKLSYHTNNSEEDEEKVVLALQDEEQVDVPIPPISWVDKVLHEFHEGSTGGHFSARATALKVMKGGYYWLNLFRDAHSWVRKCKECAMFARKERLAVLPLQPIHVEQPFMKWGLDFIRFIKPPSSAGHKWVITATDYFTKWTEAVALKEASETTILNFYDELITRFGVPESKVLDNALSFVGSRISNWLDMIEEEPMSARLAQLIELEEVRNKEMRQIEHHQAQIKRYFDKWASPRVFKEGDIVLKWDEFRSRPGKHTKFDAFWSGPYMISEYKQHNAFQLSKLDGEALNSDIALIIQSMGANTLPTRFDVPVRAENSLIQVGKIAPRPPMPFFADIQPIIPVFPPIIVVVPSFPAYNAQVVAQEHVVLMVQNSVVVPINQSQEANEQQFVPMEQGTLDVTLMNWQGEEFFGVNQPQN